MKLNGGIVGVTNEPSAQGATGLFSAAERALNVLYGTFPTQSDAFTLRNVYAKQPQPTFQTLSITAQETSPGGIFLKDDGTKVYIVGLATDVVRSYSLSVPWDLSTGTHDTLTFSVAAQDTAPMGLFFKPDGTKFYIMGTTNRRVYQYTMSTPWVISSASYDNVSFAFLQDTAPVDVTLDPSGTYMFIVGNTNDAVYKYTLTTPWDVSTAQYSNQFLGIASQSTVPGAVFVKPDGKTLYIGSSTPTPGFFQYSLGTAWDLSTASYSGLFIRGAEIVLVEAMYISPDGTRLFWADGTSAADRVRSYSIPNAWSFDGRAGFVSGISITATETQPAGVHFSTDGTKMYTTGQVADNVRQWTLTTPWLVSSAVNANKTIATGTIDLNMTDIFIRDDGLKMYTVGVEKDNVYQFTLSTAWDLATATYDNVARSVAAQSNAPSGLFFRSNGLNMYVSGVNGVHQYSLSTAWNIATATFQKTFNTSGTTSPSDTLPNGICFSPDGATMFLAQPNADFIFQYALATPWDIATASWSNNLRFYIDQYETSVQSIRFSTDGTRFYILGEISDTISQFSVNP